MIFYYENDNVEGIIKYTEEFFIKKRFSAVEIIIENNYKEYDVDYGKDLAQIDSDDLLDSYLDICSKVYVGEEYKSKVCLIYECIFNKIDALYSYDSSIKNYSALHNEKNVCIDIYDYLFENSNHVLVKKHICESKLRFIEDNNFDEQQQEAKEQLSKYDALATDDMSDAKKNKIDIVTYMEKAQRDEDWREDN